MSSSTLFPDLSFLTKDISLSAASMDLFVRPDEAKQRYLSKAGRVWSEKEQPLRGADSTMEEFIFNNHLILPKYEEEARHIIDELKKKSYGFKRDVSMLKEAVHQFSATHTPNANYRPSYRAALEAFTKLVMPKHKLRPAKFDSVDSLKEAFQNPDASCGLFACYTKCNHKVDLMNSDALNLLLELEQKAASAGRYYDPIMLGIRLQVSIPLDDDGETLKYKEESPEQLDFKYKTRMIHMVSAPEIMTGRRFTIPIERLMSGLSWAGAGKTDEQRLSQIVTWRRKYSNWTSVDYSRYDQTMPGWFIRDMMNVFKTWFILDEYENKLFDVWVESTVNKGIVSDRFGNVTDVSNGNPSGQAGTYPVNTLGHYFMVFYFLYLREQIGGKFAFQFYGDDGLIFHNGDFDVIGYIAMIKKVFGIIGNADKSDSGLRSEPPKYLSRYWMNNGPYRPWRELLIKLIFHEYDRDYSKTSPETVILAYWHIYRLGLLEGFDMRRFFRMYPNLLKNKLTAGQRKAVGGVVAFEAIYGS